MENDDREPNWSVFFNERTNTICILDKNKDHKNPIIHWMGFDDLGETLEFKDRLDRANLIVTAFNSHKPLIEALEKAQTELLEAADKFWVIHCNHPGKHVSDRQEEDKQFLSEMYERMSNAADEAHTALSLAKVSPNQNTPEQ